MNIVVCIKQVPDTNEVKIDPKTGTLIRDGIPSIMNPDDKAGLEAALRIKDECGAHVTVVSMGPMQADAVLREALAMGADEGYLISDRAFGGADTWATSSTIASAIEKLPYDLIITGRQAIDGDTAQVGPQIAEHLGLANISYAEDIKVEGEYVVVKRQFEDRYHVIKAKMPCLITALSELNEPRYMTPAESLTPTATATSRSSPVPTWRSATTTSASRAARQESSSPSPRRSRLPAPRSSWIRRSLPTTSSRSSKRNSSSDRNLCAVKLV